MKINEAQNEILEFDKKRNWDSFYPLELMANFNEEIGEIWQRIAWVPNDKKIELVKKYEKELEGDIGDLLFLVLKLANQFGLNAESGLKKTLREYEIRFPVDKLLKGDGTANKTTGLDLK